MRIIYKKTLLFIFTGIFTLIGAASAQTTYDLQLTNKTFPLDGTMDIDLEIKATQTGQSFDLRLAEINITHDNEGTGVGEMTFGSVVGNSGKPTSANSSSGEITVNLTGLQSTITIDDQWTSLATITYTLGKGTTNSDDVIMIITSAGTEVRDDNFALVNQGTFTDFDSGTPLPVELTSFTATWSKAKQAVELNWETAQEINNSHFLVQCRTTEGEWANIAKVEGHGNVMHEIQYSYLDHQSFASHSSAQGEQTQPLFYRLKQEDYNGDFEFSPLVSLMTNQETVNPTTTTIQVWPNPASNQLSINTEGQLVEAQLFNLQGQLVLTSQQATMQISHLPQGHYLLAVQQADGLTVREKVVIQ